MEFCIKCRFCIYAKYRNVLVKSKTELTFAGLLCYSSCVGRPLGAVTFFKKVVFLCALLLIKIPGNIWKAK